MKAQVKSRNRMFNLEMEDKGGSLNEEKSFNQTGIILLPDCRIERIFSYIGTGT